MSMADIDAAALAAARNRPVVMAKFIANAVNAVSPYIVPALAIAATFATGGAAAPLAFASQMANGVSMAAHMVGGQPQGGGGVGGLAGNLLGQYGGLGGIAGSGVNAALSAAAANQAEKRAIALQDHAFDRMGSATKQSIADFQGILGKYKNPATSGVWNPSFAPQNFTPIRSSQVGSVGGYSVPGYNSAPQTGYDSPPPMPQSPFAAYGGDMSAFPGMGGTMTPPLGQGAPTAPQVAQIQPTGNTRNALQAPSPFIPHTITTPWGHYSRRSQGADETPFSYYGDPQMKEA